MEEVLPKEPTGSHAKRDRRKSCLLLVLVLRRFGPEGFSISAPKSHLCSSKRAQAMVGSLDACAGEAASVPRDACVVAQFEDALRLLRASGFEFRWVRRVAASVKVGAEREERKPWCTDDNL